MKIVHLMLACFYIDNYSYQENLLPKYHQLMGNEVEIIASLESYDENGVETYLPGADKYINEYGIPVTRLNYRKGFFFRRLRSYQGLMNELERIRPDIIFIHGVQFSDIRIVAKYCTNHVETIVYVDNHSDFSNSAKTWISKHLLHRVVWRHYAHLINSHVKCFYGVLPARVDFLHTEYGIPSSKIKLLVMGADDERVKQSADSEVRRMVRSKYGIGRDDFLIMTGGKIDAFKLQTLLLMKAVQKENNYRNRNIKLIVFGSVTPELQDKVKSLSDGQKVQYIGWVSSNYSYDLFAASDLVVFPGRHSVFWEQVAAQGKPMIVKYWEGTTHIDCGGNVLFLYNDSTEEILDRINYVLSENHYEEMNRVALSASSKFLYSSIAKESIEIE